MTRFATILAGALALLAAMPAWAAAPRPGATPTAAAQAASTAARPITPAAKPASPPHATAPKIQATFPAAETSPPPTRAAATVPIGFVNAADLRDWCLSSSPTLASSCFAYITGVHDTVRAYEAWLNLKEYCVPPGVTQSDLRNAFLDYITHSPEHVFGEAGSVVVVALKQGFPCTAATPNKGR